jgi:hypothetical protein
VSSLHPTITLPKKAQSPTPDTILSQPWTIHPSHFTPTRSSNMASSNSQNLAPIVLRNPNQSLSSVNSDAATFHSAHAHTSVELKYMSSGQAMQASQDNTPTARAQSPAQTALPSPKLEALKMARQDSGYGAGQESSSSSRRASAASSTWRPKSPSRHDSTPSARRPSTKRASRSSPTTAQTIRTSTSSRRPDAHTRHNSAPTYQQAQNYPYQFFEFPTLQDPAEIAPPRPPPPPATCQYWTSDSTRRLEYAAIDAASRGVRGFFFKMVPDCILPPSSRRLRFHCDEEASDAGSVRRYRLVLPEEKDLGPERQEERRPSGLRRWTSAWRRSIS